jgi:hypothetical protein
MANGDNADIVKDSDIDSALGQAKSAVSDANKAVPVSTSPAAPLFGQTSQPTLQGGTVQGTTPQVQPAPSNQPTAPVPQFTAPTIAPNPLMAAGAAQNAAHPVTAPTLTMPSSNLPALKETPTLPQPQWWQHMLGNNPMQNAARGSLAALVGGVDTLDTAAHAIGQPIAGALGAKMEPPVNAQKAYEETLPQGTTDEPGYQVGKGATELAGYAVQGAIAPGVGTAGMLGEGAAWGGLNSAQEQLRETGNIDPTKTAEAALLGAGISGVGMAAGKAWRLAKYKGAKKKLAQITGKTEEEIANMKGKGLKEHFANIADEINTKNEKDTAKLNELMNSKEGGTTLQRSQQEALKEWEAKQATKTATKVEGHVVKGEKAVAGKLEPQGQYRHPKFGKGFEIIEHAEPIENLEKQLGKEAHVTLKQAVEAMGFAKSWVMLLQNDREAFAKNAIAMAQSAAQKAKIEMIEKEDELTSAAKEAAAKYKSELHLEQQQHIKGQVKAQRDKLIDQIKTAPKKAKIALRKQLAEVNKALESDNMPEILKVPQEKYLYGIADRAVSEEQEAGRNLANNFDDAFAQFKDADKKLLAAEQQYAKLSKDLLPIFAHAEAAMNESTGELKRLFVRYEISHPFQRNVTTPFAVGTQFKGSTVNLIGLFKKRYAGFVKELHAQQENIVKEKIYQVGQLVDELERMHISQADKDAALKALGAKYEPSKELAKAMAKSKSLHPSAQKLLLIAGLGMAASDIPASASDGSPEHRDNHFGLSVGGVLIAAYLISRFGVAGAHQLGKSNFFRLMTDYKNTRTLAGGADKVLNAAAKLNFVTHPTETLQYRLNELGGHIFMAINLAPDDGEYLRRAIFDRREFAEIEKQTGKRISPLGRKLAGEIQEMADQFKGFVTQYNKAWTDHIKSLPEKDREALQEITDAVRFVDGFMNPEHMGNVVDRFGAEQMARTSKAIFYANPRQVVLNMVANVAINGPLQVGPQATAAAFKAYANNSRLRGLINKISHGGPQTQFVQSVSSKAKTMVTEAQSSRFMMLASMAHYYDSHLPQMKLLKIKGWEDFAIKLLEDKLPEQTALDAHIQMYVDLTETLGGDPLKLVGGPFSRANLGRWVKYFGDIERYKALFLINWQKRNYKWLAASLLMLQQFGGKSAIPIELQIIGYALTPAMYASFAAFLDNWSLIGHTTGDMSHSLGWGLLVPAPAMGQIMPGISNILDTMNGLEQGAANIPEIFHAIANGGLMGDPANETNEKAQKTLRSGIGLLAQAFPTVADIPFLKDAPPVPLESIAAALYNLPKFMHNEMAVSVPNPVALGSGAHPLESTKIVRAPSREATLETPWGKVTIPTGLSTAQWESLRGMLRLGPGISSTLYKDYGTGKVLSKGKPEMARKQEAALRGK